MRHRPTILLTMTQLGGRTGRRCWWSSRSAALSTSEVARLGTDELMEAAARAFRVRCSQDAVLATCVPSWIAVRTGGRPGPRRWVRGWSSTSGSAPPPPGLPQVAEHVSDLPHLGAGLLEGRLSLDKVRSVLGVATPENEAEWAEAAENLSVHDLEALVRSRRRRRGARIGPTRRSARCASTSARTIVAQLAPVPYAAVRSVLESRVKAMGSDGETPLDQRRADAFVAVMTAGPSSCPRPPGGGPRALRGAQRPRVRAPRRARTGRAHQRRGGAAPGLRGHGDRRPRRPRRPHLYEGRAQRFPTPTQRREVLRRDRHCAFPGCAHVVFTNCHHIDGWKPGGLTDLSNLVLLCKHHHDLIHHKVWSSGRRQRRAALCRADRPGDDDAALAPLGPGHRPQRARRGERRRGAGTGGARSPGAAGRRG